MVKLFKQMSASIALLACSHMANASLITNGSFEQTTFGDSTVSYGAVKNTDLADFANKQRGWDVFNIIPGWYTSYGNGIELQKGVVTASQDGFQHIELDSHRRNGSNSMMTQTIDSLIVGEEYVLEFFYKARTNNQNDNGINVYWHDAAANFDMSMDAIYAADGIRRDTPNWQKQTVSFRATSTSMNLSFASFGTQNTLGGLIDNVSLNHVAQVPEPSMIALMLLPIGFLAVRKKKAKVTS
ncbi:DUF642 domain-containing protein [Thalassotalea euphylliae]|uniref:DUF642 domain-containing protein n=1 Tax=Thalassotalea euphylliae TaxID=1655234 RepID=UPI003627E2AD